MSLMLRSITTIFLLACATAFAATTATPRPLPPTVLEAKTIYIDNQTGKNNLTARAIAELKTWGRFTVVNDPAKADITLTISMQAKENPDGDDERTDITLQIMLPHDDIPQFSRTQDTLARFMESEVSKTIRTLRRRVDEQERNKTTSTASMR